jgi:hypothetical protein
MVEGMGVFILFLAPNFESVVTLYKRDFTAETAEYAENILMHILRTVSVLRGELFPLPPFQSWVIYTPATTMGAS